MTVALELDLGQILSLVSKLPRREKETLACFLDDQTLFEELRTVQRELKRAPITPRQIAAEVKLVRRNRAGRAPSLRSGSA